jgi:hypothetical protein
MWVVGCSGSTRPTSANGSTTKGTHEALVSAAQPAEDTASPRAHADVSAARVGKAGEPPGARHPQTSVNLRLPFQEGRPLDAAAVSELPLYLEGEQRQIARQFLMAAHLSGCKSVEDALASLEAMGQAERRKVLDACRVKAGLESATAIESRRRVERVNTAARVQAGGGWQMCHGDGCNEAPVNELGVPVAVNVRKWFCDAHMDQARPGDMEPCGSGIRIAPSGALVPIDEGEEQRAAEEAESRRRQLEERAAGREHEAAVSAEHKRLRDEAARRQVPPGMYAG